LNAITKLPRLATVEAVARARALLAESQDLGDVLELRDQAVAMAAYAKQKTDSTEAYASAWKIQKLAERRFGELSSKLPKSKPGPRASTAEIDQDPVLTPPPVPKKQALAALGITPANAARFERSAEIPEDEFKARIDQSADRMRKGKAAKNPESTTSASDYHSDEWGTPAKFVEAARAVFGGAIELDPASNAMAQNTVRAERWHHKTDSGLIIPWNAKSVWLNFPFSRLLAANFVEKCCTEYAAGNFPEGIVLSNSSTETGWYQSLLKSCSAICLPDERIAFELMGRPVDDNRNAQTFFYLGDQLQAFHREFHQFGEILTPLRGFL
jgi:hypothetical protein